MVGLQKLTESNGGAVWSIASHPLVSVVTTVASPPLTGLANGPSSAASSAATGTSANATATRTRVLYHGHLVALGCEDGSVRLFKLHEPDGKRATPVEHEIQLLLQEMPRHHPLTGATSWSTCAAAQVLTDVCCR
jgi:hypothetical protein